MLKEKYLNEKIEKLKELIFQGKAEEARDCLSDIMNFNYEFTWMVRQANNIRIFDYPYNELSKIIDILDHWESGFSVIYFG